MQVSPPFPRSTDLRPDSTVESARMVVPTSGREDRPGGLRGRSSLRPAGREPSAMEGGPLSENPTERSIPTRRGFLAGLIGLAAIATAGCGSDSGGDFGQQFEKPK